MQLTVPLGLGVIGRAVVERQPIAIADVSQSDLFDALLQDPQRRELQAALLARFRAWLAVPLMMQDEMYGGLVLYYPDTREFSAEEISLAVSLSDQAALAIENARLHEQASQLATLQERQRLARELHDSVSQALYGIALGAHTARAQLERDPHKAIEPLDYVLTLADAGLTEMRALIFELRPESLAQEGLVVALTKQAAALRARHQLTVRTALGTESKVALAVKEVFYRIAQESFHNIVKHARAKCVEVRLTQSDGVLTLEVQDDGRGFVPRREFPGHLGLQSMRERVASVGGTLDIESAQGQGTRIRASVPVEWATA
jgi:signal transduction histidine kinase